MYTFYKNNVKLKLCLALLMVFMALSSYATQLNGTYTIDPSFPATTGNFHDFASAITYLTSDGVRADGGPSNTAPFGVGGPVVFNVANGTYQLTQSLVIPQITGASAANTITFTGGAGNASSCIISGSLTTEALVILQLTSYITLDNLTIINNGGGASPAVAIIGNTTSTAVASNCAITNCIVSLPAARASNVINVTGANTGIAASANKSNNIIIQNNQISGGAYSVGIRGNANNSDNYGYKITNNTITQSFQGAIYLENVYNGFEINNNKLDLSRLNVGTQYGIFLNACLNANSSNAPITVIGNTISNASSHGIYLNNLSSTSSNVTKIYNNMINGGARAATNYGVFFNNTVSSNIHNVEFYHNSIIRNHASSTTSNALRFNHSGTPVKAEFVNNILMHEGNGTNNNSIPFYLTNNNATVVDYNNYVNTTAARLVYRAGTNYDATGYKTAAAGGANSINITTRFKGNDLHLFDACANRGTNVNVLTDIDGETRSSTPFIGCDEVLAYSLDLMVENIVTPTSPFTPGASALSVLVSNPGVTPITSWTMAYVHNSNAAVTETFTSTIQPCSSAIVNFTSQPVLTAKNTFEVYAYSANGSVDNNATNDTVRKVLNSPLSGTYNIGGATPDFASIQEAVNELNSFGVSGPVYFNIHPGTYTGQVVVNANITGVSATDTIVFDGGSRTTTFVEANVPAGGVFFVRSGYITIKNLNIRNTNAGSGAGVSFSGSLSYCRVSDCEITLDYKGSLYTSSTAGTGFGIIVTGNANGFPLSASASTYITIENNIINDGCYGIGIQGANANGGSQGFRINGNRIVNATRYGIRVLNARNVIHAIGNTVIMNPSPDVADENSQVSGIVFDNCPSNSGSHQVIGNYVTNSRYNGIYIYSDGTQPYPHKIHNNVVAGNLPFQGDVVGINLYSANWNSYFEVYHNTVNITNANLQGTQQYAIKLVGNFSSEFKNNIMASSGSNISSSSFQPFGIFGNGTIAGNFDHNIYYNSVGGALMFLGNTQTRVGRNDINTASTGGVSSLVKKPAFIDANNNNLQLTHGCDVGDSLIHIVSTDINGVVRTKSVIGAYVPTPSNLDIMIESLDKPVAPITLGYQDLRFTVRNIGTTPVTSFTGSYTYNGSFPISEYFYGNLETCDTVSVLFTAASQINLGALNDIEVFVSDVNYLVDDDSSNDTLTVTFKAPLVGNFTIGSSANADFPDFTSAVNELKAVGIGGPVTFVAEPGIYNERLEIDQDILGASYTNTITFDGVDSADCKIVFGNTAYDNRHVVKIATSHIHLRNLTIDNTSPDQGTAIHISKSGLENIHIKNSLLIFSDSKMLDMQKMFRTIVASNSTSDMNEGAFKIDSIEIDSNTMVNGASGVLIDNGQGEICSNIKIRGNKILNYYDRGIWMFTTNGYDISNNEISAYEFADQGCGIWIENRNDRFDTADAYMITNNKIWGTGEYGIFLMMSFPRATTPGLIANNVITNFRQNGQSGVYTKDASHVKFIHNTIDFDVPADNDFRGCVRFNGGTGVDLKYNILSVSANSSMAMPLVVNSNARGGNNTNECDYNLLYHVDGGSVFGDEASGSLQKFDATNFIGANGYNVHSHSVNPAYTNDTFLTTTNPCLNADTMLIAYDLNGNPRLSNPDIGAYEIALADYDASVSALLQPVKPAAAGAHDLLAVITNYGTYPLNVASVSYQYGNAAPVGLVWTGALTTCESDTVVFSGPDQITLTNSTQQLKVYTEYPNNMVDMAPGNDSIITNIGAALSGPYTIGGTTPDFATFNDAVTALNVRGVVGAVVFNVRPGTYTEKIVIEGVSGASATNTITFKAENNVNTSVTLEYAGTSYTDYSIVTLRGANYINFKTMSFRTLTSTYGVAIDIVGEAAFDTIENCVFNSATLNNAQDYRTALICAYYTNPRNIVIRNNTFNNGGYSIYMMGSNMNKRLKNILIEGNTMNLAAYQTINAYYTVGLQVLNNNITPSNVATNHTAINVNYADSGFSISGNKINMSAARSIGLYVTNSNGFDGYRGLISNNVIVIGGVTGTTNYKGLHVQNSRNIDVFHNTVNNISTSTTTGTAGSYAAYFQLQSGYTGNTVKYNVFTNTGLGCAVFNHTPVATNVFSNNLYYANGTNIIATNTAQYQTLDVYKNVFSYLEEGTVVYRPAYTSNTNLTPNLADSAAWVINGRALHHTVVTTDVNGNARPTTLAQGAPDLGAFEITPTSLPPLATATPEVALPGDVQVFTFLGDTVATIKWETYSDIPDSIKVRQYAGVAPQNIPSTSGFNYFYTDIEVPYHYYYYDLSVYYKQHWLGTVVNEENLKLAKQSGTDPWTPFLAFNSEVDTARNMITARYQNYFSKFTGTDEFNPLPVVLTSIDAKAANKDVVVTWNTASEVNSAKFIVEASNDGKNFRSVGEVQAKGNSSIASSYAFVHHNAQVAMGNANTIYYRLVAVDRDGSADLSRVVSVVFNPNAIAIENAVVYPNPFQNNFVATIPAINDGKAEVSIVDVHGKVISVSTHQLTAGTNQVEFSQLQNVNAGVYFVKFVVDGQAKVVRLIKK